MNESATQSTRQVQITKRNLFLLVVIPCLNEEPTVAHVGAAVPRDIPGIGRIEILVIDDGSTDDTASHARDAGAEIVRHQSNQGLGKTFQEAVGIALDRGADVMVHIDGDGQFEPADIPLLVEPIAITVMTTAIEPAVIGGMSVNGSTTSLAPRCSLIVCI